MALSPWHVASKLSEYEVAALLGGYDFTALEADYVKDHELCEIKQWVVVILDAARANELKPELVIMRADIQTGTSEEGYPHFEEEWQECLGDEWLDVDHKYIHMTFNRQEVYRWLKASGIADADIPEALRVIPGQEAPANQPHAQTVEADELRTLEALGLLVETFAKQEAHTHKYRIGEAGRPNCAQIAKAMNNQACDVYGMSESKLQRLLSKALTTWQEKCK